MVTKFSSFEPRLPSPKRIKLGNSLKYPGFSYENLGRFVCVELKKKFLGAIS